MLLSSCSSWIDSSMNIDPNNPKDVAMAQLLGPIEVNLAYIAGGELSRNNCEWMQQIAGLTSQSADIDIYKLTETDVDNAWSFNLYTPGMINLKILMEKAVSTMSPAYGGVAKVLMAYYLGVTTDLWGDIPYSNALNGASDHPTSTYDTQQTIYTTIFTLLNGAITDLSSTASVFTPDVDDVIYKGDLDKWTKTAYALIARNKLHLAKINGAAAYTDALAALTNAYTASDEDFKVTFGSAYSNSNPLYQFMDQRAYIAANTTMMDMLKATNDPRLGVYFEGTDTSTVKNVVKLAYFGSASGEGNTDASIFGANYSSADSPVLLISFTELQFIKAEALFQTSNLPGAATAYNAGLKASLTKEGVYDATWYAANTLTAATITLEKIMNQKYLSSFLQIETFTDWRRTGFPTLTLATGAFTTEIPRRYPYPSLERLYNGANMPKGITIVNRVWWDKK